MNMIQVIRKGADSTFKVGQSSVSAAREDEIRVRDRFLAVFADLQAVAEESSMATGDPIITKRMGDFIRGLEDLQDDCSLRKSDFDAQIASIT